MSQTTNGLVLASGGIDSSTLLGLAREDGMATTALFIDYGQPATASEEAAVSEICAHFAVPLRVVRYRGRRFSAGEIRGRNAFFLQTALMEFPSEPGIVMIGIHAGTGYRDCSPEFIDLMRRSFEFHTGGAITIAAPFAGWTKQDVFRLASNLNIPWKRTYSCEAAPQPCGRCRSCLDRRALHSEDPLGRA